MTRQYIPLRRKWCSFFLTNLTKNNTIGDSNLKKEAKLTSKTVVPAGSQLQSTTLKFRNSIPKDNISNLNLPGANKVNGYHSVIVEYKLLDYFQIVLSTSLDLLVRVTSMTTMMYCLILKLNISEFLDLSIVDHISWQILSVMLTKNIIFSKECFRLSKTRNLELKSLLSWYLALLNCILFFTELSLLIISINSVNICWNTSPKLMKWLFVTSQKKDSSLSIKLLWNFWKELNPQLSVKLSVRNFNLDWLSDFCNLTS